MLLANFNRKEHLRHRAVSLRQHGFLVYAHNSSWWSYETLTLLSGDAMQWLTFNKTSRMEPNHSVVGRMQTYRQTNTESLNALQPGSTQLGGYWWTRYGSDSAFVYVIFVYVTTLKVKYEERKWTPVNIETVTESNWLEHELSQRHVYSLLADLSYWL